MTDHGYAFARIESVATQSGNSGHVVVLEAWIGKKGYRDIEAKRE
jgi:hypothetical protein